MTTMAASRSTSRPSKPLKKKDIILLTISLCPLRPSRRSLILFASEDSSSPQKAKHVTRSKAQSHDVSIQRIERFRRQTATHDSEHRPSVVSFSCFFAWNRINAG